MRRFISVEALFSGRHFDRQIIILCVSWYISFKLSFRDLVIMMADRGISLAHTTILRWVQRYLPEFEKRWKRYARAVGGSWRMDETYIKVRGRWVYLYRAVDKAGGTVDFFLSRNRDVNAAKSFLRSAMKNTRTPTKITLDAYAASHRAVREMKEDRELPRRVQVRSSQYLNNLIEQDHRRVKQRIRPMLGFKRFDYAVVTLSGIELAEKIKKEQFKTGKLGGAEATMSELWNATMERGTRCVMPVESTDTPERRRCRISPEFAPEAFSDAFQARAGLQCSDTVALLGGESDRSGLPGITQAKVDQFYAEANALSDWWQKAEVDAATIFPLGEGTAAALEAVLRAEPDLLTTDAKSLIGVEVVA